MKKIVCGVMIISLFFVFFGCSYKELDDALQGGEPKFQSLPDVEITDKEVGETHPMVMDTWVTGNMEVTLLKKQVFQTVEESGIDPAECIDFSFFLEEPEKYVFLLLDVEVYNIDAVLDEGFDEELPFLISGFFPITEVNEDNPEMGSYGCEIIYFSEHPPITSTSTNYYHYDIAPGERLRCQMGIMAAKVDYENQNLWLSIGGLTTGNYFELFEGAGETEGEKSEA